MYEKNNKKKVQTHFSKRTMGIFQISLVLLVLSVVVVVVVEKKDNILSVGD